MHPELIKVANLPHFCEGKALKRRANLENGREQGEGIEQREGDIHATSPFERPEIVAMAVEADGLKVTHTGKATRAMLLVAKQHR